MKHIIIGTAGHIDHGKTTLIKALTGRDTDTLKEEKERGISINLGFTYFDLPSGKRAGIVDVPGHEKFIKNMLAGVSGIDMVLLVIAADEGIMPQTREHINILSLLDVKNGIVVVTKKDMVDDEWLSIVMEDIKEYLKDTFLEKASIIPVSSISGEGLNELIKNIDMLSEKVVEKDILSSFRLPIDRVFTVSGFGTVVTGTLISGKVSEGDKICIYPSNIETRIRNIQVHEQPVKSAFAGQRVAINLSNIKVEDVKRGDMAAEAGSIQPSMMIDCRLNYLKDAPRPLQNRDRLRIYHGTSELLGRVVILDKEILNQGEKGLVQIRLESPISALKGDKYVIRTYSPMITIGGGTIIDPNPPKRKRFDSNTIEELLIKEEGDLEDIVEQVVLKNSRQFPNMSTIIKLSGASNSQVEEILKNLEKKRRIVGFSLTEGVCYIHIDFFNNLLKRVREYLIDFHSKYPLKCGMAKEEIKSRLFQGNIKQKLFDDILLLLEKEKVVKSNGKSVSLYDFEITLNIEYQRIKDKILQIYNSSGVDVPKFDDVIASLEGNIDSIKMVFELLLETGEIIKINEEFYISRTSYDNVINALQRYLVQNKEITLAQYRDLLNTSRKYAVWLLEYFDQIKITKRIGDKRVLY